MRRRTKKAPIEKYGLERSPFSQHPTQREIGELVGETRDDLRRLVNYKEQFIVRRQAVTGKKQKLRDLKYPVGRLRAVHERLKFHLTKIKQPSYLFSPRHNRGQRDNASLHADQDQYLTLDLKQFYPSTTASMVRRWFQEELGMYPDVAGLLTHLCTIDDQVSFGSPLTPVLCSLIHRQMFDRIADLCLEHGLRYSIWVDDVTISGKFVPGTVLAAIREIIREYGLKSHRVKYRTGKRPVFITGVGVVGRRLVAPAALHLKIKELWEAYHLAQILAEKDGCTTALLGHLGTLRHIEGGKSEGGRKAADQMNSLRQKRSEMHAAAIAKANAERLARSLLPKPEDDELPFDIAPSEIITVAATPATV